MVIFRFLRVDWQSPTLLHFPAVNRGQSWYKHIWKKKNTYLNQLNIRKPLVVSNLQYREDLRFYSLLYKLLATSSPGQKRVSLNASPGWTVLFFPQQNRLFTSSAIHRYMETNFPEANAQQLVCLNDGFVTSKNGCGSVWLIFESSPYIMCPKPGFLLKVRALANHTVITNSASWCGQSADHRL